MANEQLAALKAARDVLAAIGDSSDYVPGRTMEVLSEVNQAIAHERVAARAPQMLRCLRGALIQWSEAIGDDDYPVDGGDMVEWFLGEFVPEAKRAIRGLA